MKWRWYYMAAGVVGGMLLNTSWEGTPFVHVYNDPEWYVVVREDNRISYQTAGRRDIECEHVAPITVEVQDKVGNFLSKELIHRGQSYQIIGVPNVESDPREFIADHTFRISTDTVLEQASQFYILVECTNREDGRFSGRFGPIPIPENDDHVIRYQVPDKLPLTLRPFPDAD